MVLESLQWWQFKR